MLMLSKINVNVIKNVLFQISKSQLTVGPFLPRPQNVYCQNNTLPGYTPCHYVQGILSCMYRKWNKFILIRLVVINVKSMDAHQKLIKTIWRHTVSLNESKLTNLILVLM